MFTIQSKYSTSHSTALAPWLRQNAIRLWNSVPNKFTKPHSSDYSFAFVCGCGHSGTTLAAARLGQHQEIFLIGRETNAFGPVMSSMASKSVVREWEYFAEVAGKKFILEKTPKHVQAVEKIRRILPSAKIILIKRNPLDNVASLYSRFGDLESSIRRWLADNHQVLRFRDMPGFHIVGYEELTSNPDYEFDRICKFLKLPWDSSILTAGSSLYGAIAQKDENMNLRVSQTSRPIRQSIGKWKEILSSDQIREVVRRTERLSAKIGYSTLPVT